MEIQEEIESKAKQMKKGIIEYILLSQLSKKEMYAKELVAAFTDTPFQLPEGTIYPILSRLKKTEIIIYTWVESESGHPRKYYQLSPKGELILPKLAKVWEDLQKTVAITTNSEEK